MKVHIVTEGNWIKKFWSDKIIEYNKTNIQYSMGLSPLQDVDINFYICFNTFLPFNKTNVLDIGYVTHIHENNPKSHTKDIGMSFEKFRIMDAWIHQSKRSMQQFVDLGFPIERNFNLTSAIEIHKFKPTITIGIFQNGEVIGKGLYFMKDLIDEYDLSNFKFIFCGRGWELVTNKMKEKNIRYEVITYSPNEYHNVEQNILYERLDYFLVPSLWEGGPVAPLEAMACGVPIISSDVGLIPEFNIEHMFPAGNLIKLIEIIEKIEAPVLERRKKVEHLSYEEFNNKLYNIFKNFINN